MTFNEWLKITGMAHLSLARMCNLSRITIQRLAKGRRPYGKTLTRLVKITKTMKPPITYDMFQVASRKKPENKVYTCCCEECSK